MSHNAPRKGQQGWQSGTLGRTRVPTTSVMRKCGRVEEPDEDSSNAVDSAYGKYMEASVGETVTASAPVTECPTRRSNFDSECEHGVDSFCECLRCLLKEQESWRAANPGEVNSVKAAQVLRDLRSPGGFGGGGRQELPHSRQEMFNTISRDLNIDSVDLGPKGQLYETDAWVDAVASKLGVELRGGKVNTLRAIFTEMKESIPDDAFNDDGGRADANGLRAEGVRALRDLVIKVQSSAIDD